MKSAVAARLRAASPPALELPLPRSLGAGDVLVLTLSALSPAASLFITGSALLHLAGTGAVAALLIGGVAINLASLLYAELGAAFPSAGGVYPGIAGVLGRRWGRSAIALGLVTMPAIIAFHALGLADYLRVLAPAIPRLPIALAAIAGATVIAAANIRTSALITGLFFAAEMLAVAAVTLAGGVRPARAIGDVLAQPQMIGDHGLLVATPAWTVGVAAITAAFACSGSSLAISFSEDMRRRPQRVGWIVVAGGAVGTIVIAVPLIRLVLGTPDLAATLAAEAPIAYHLAATMGPMAARIAAIGVTLAVFNNLIANLLAFSRFLYATGRDGTWSHCLSGWLARLNRRSRSPLVAVLMLATAAAGLCLLGERLLLMLISGELITPSLVVVAVLVGRTRGLTGRTSFRASLFPVTPVLALALIGSFLAAEWADPGEGRPSLIILSAIAAGAYLLSGSAVRGTRA